MRGRSLHKRRIETEAFENGEDSIIVVGQLIDNFNVDLDVAVYKHAAGTAHDLRVEMDVSLPDFTITAVRTDMATVPYDDCHNAGSMLQSLVGVRVAAGYSREVRERLKATGVDCAHLMTLVLAMPTTALLGGAFKMIGQPEMAVHLKEGDSFLLDSCHMWREDGPLARAQWNGRVPGGARKRRASS